MLAYVSGFELGANVLGILSITAVLVATSKVIGHTIASNGKMVMGFLLNVLWAVALISASSPLI